MAKKKKAKKRAAKKHKPDKVKTRPRQPSNNGADGHNRKGQFAKGNKCSVGNLSHTNETARALKKAFLEAITEKDVKAICKALAKKAKKGDTPAAKELFDRLWGRAKQEVDIGENATNTLADIVARMCGNASSTE